MASYSDYRQRNALGKAHLLYLLGLATLVLLALWAESQFGLAAALGVVFVGSSVGTFVALVLLRLFRRRGRKST